MKHHPSCKPDDTVLALHCNQCGEDEFVSDSIEQFKKEIDVQFEMISYLREQNKILLEALEKYAAERNWLEDEGNNAVIFGCSETSGFELAAEAIKKVKQGEK